jgi:3-oxoacyl-[acyl-carrier protein] reductase
MIQGRLRVVRPMYSFPPVPDPFAETSISPTHVIIGSSAGIGNALVRHSLNISQTVFGVSRGEIDLPGTGYTHIIGDARDPAAFVSFLPRKFEYLTFCPGQIFLGSMRRTTPADLLKSFEANVVDAYRVISALRNHITKSIVLISSVAAKVGIPNHSAISASKSALEGLVRTMAAELAPRIRVNAVAPTLSPTATATNLVGGEEALSKISALHPLKTLPSPEEVASAISFFHTSAHSVTGQSFAVDSGMSTLNTP